MKSVGESMAIGHLEESFQKALWVLRNRHLWMGM